MLTRDLLCQGEQAGDRHRDSFGPQPHRAPHFRVPGLHGHETRPCLLRGSDEEEPQTRSLAVPDARGGRAAEIRPIRIEEKAVPAGPGL